MTVNRINYCAGRFMRRNTIALMILIIIDLLFPHHLWVTMLMLPLAITGLLVGSVWFVTQCIRWRRYRAEERAEAERY